MKPVCIACFLMLCLAFRPTWAQDAGTGEVFVPQVASSTEPISHERAVQLIREQLHPQDQRLLDGHAHMGYHRGGHLALVHQDGAGSVTLVNQDGASNLAAMYQNGTGNTTQLMQYGTGNVYGAWLTGDDNSLSVAQRGDENTYLLELAGDGLAIEAVQLGTGNQAVQLGTASTPFDIEQRGDGMTLIIQHDTP